MTKLDELGILTGRTITKSIMEKAEKAFLPDAVMSELWPGRTMARVAMDTIKTAMNKKKPVVIKVTEENKEHKS